MKFCSEGAVEENARYSETIHKFRRVWGKDKVHMVIMEEMWNPDTQPKCLKELSDFLEFPIDKVHRNVYYPDMGPNAPKYEYLKDQWCSNTVALDRESWEYVRKNLDWIYRRFERSFGYIPDEWGKWYET